MATREEILKGLNEDQLKAATDYMGPCYVVAGPGSGKTHTVVSRTNLMIHEGINANSIVLFTFTNKAAKEIKARIIKTIGEEGHQITVGTYHSVCVRILKKYADYIGFDNKFSIYDTDDSLGELKELTKGLTFDAKAALNYISDCKNKLITSTLAVQNAQSDLDRQYADIYRRYQNRLKEQNAMDFDDLITNTIRLLESNHDILSNLNDKWKYITADEFHDSCPRDIRLIDLLGGKDKNICMILDDEQSIYSFRGADITAVLSVKSIFPGLKTFVLRQNYRSTKTIVSAARSLIKKNKEQIDKTIFSENDDGAPVLYFDEATQSNESLRVVKLIALLTSKYGLKNSDVAILYRMSYLSRSMEDALLRAGIHYKIVGGTSFYSRKEIKDVLSFARLIYNPYDYEAFKRAIAIPKRGIGDASIEKIYEFSRNHYSRPTDLLTASKEVELKGKAASGLNNFNELMEQLQALFETESASDFIKYIINLTDYTEVIKKEEDKASKVEDKIQNLQELVNLAASFETIEELLQNVCLDGQINDDGEEVEAVELMTMHASKGLEYKAVIIIGANEGINPHFRAITQKEVEEERRLMYVAMTRAEQYLFITRSRVMMQQNRPNTTRESRFIKEIDKRFMETYRGK
jgi:DNA helicase-2/ATP-dependent DNA helicase PcrA